jgi:hypothetical protein
MIKTSDNSNQHGGWYSPVADSFNKQPVTLSGYVLDAYHHYSWVEVHFHRGDHEYHKHVHRVAQPYKEKTPFSITLNDLPILGPNIIHAIFRSDTDPYDLPSIQEFYVLTPAQEV